MHAEGAVAAAALGEGPCSATDGRRARELRGRRREGGGGAEEQRAADATGDGGSKGGAGPVRPPPRRWPEREGWRWPVAGEREAEGQRELGEGRETEDK